MSPTPLTWTELEALTDFEIDRTNGPTNAKSRLRLFGKTEADVRVTLYRDNHAWCPYCQKIWLWLEEKEIPYRIEKVTMFCYGNKESWYKRKVPSGMLPALELDGRVITESDDILIALEKAFGPLNLAMNDSQVKPMRYLERLLFRVWCNWLCRSQSQRDDDRSREQFIEIMQQVETALSATPGPYFLAVEYSPRKVKQSVTGSGSASKEQVAYMLESILKQKLEAEFFDATDAVAIAICHHYHANSPASVSLGSKKGSKKGGWGAFVSENPNRIK